MDPLIFAAKVKATRSAVGQGDDSRNAFGLPFDFETEWAWRGLAAGELRELLYAKSV